MSKIHKQPEVKKKDRNHYTDDRSITVRVGNDASISPDSPKMGKPIARGSMKMDESRPYNNI